MNRIRLYIIEEQEILRAAYRVCFPSEETIEIVGMADSMDMEAIPDALATVNPDVVLIGTKMLESGMIEELEIIGEQSPNVGMILLSTLYDGKGIKRLREFTKKSIRGYAFLLKHSIDKIDQLTQVVQSVQQGQVILDPMVMEGLIGAGEAKTALLKDLTHRELEVLSWMAKGFRNATIADVLCVDPKTIERHINSIYRKINMGAESKHPRVHATILYLKATGQLPIEGFSE